MSYCMTNVRLEEALESLRNGKMIVVYDGDEREGEADLMIAAQYTKPETIETLRRDAGGLICLAVPGPAATRLGLPFMTDVLDRFGGTASLLSCKRTAYGDKPAFSLSINHEGVFTGITDNDRALTITKFDALVREHGKPADPLVSAVRNKAASCFTDEFYSPGHVFLLMGRGIENRKGHTELSLELARRAGSSGGMVMCEMLGNKNGKAMAKKDAIAYAKRHGLAFIEGKEILG